MEFADLEEVKTFFDIDDSDLDELLSYLIEHYSEIVADKTNATTQTIAHKEALLYAIGCHLSKIHLDKISPTIFYTAGDVEEKFQIPDKSEISWCDLYREKIAEILAKTKSAYSVASGKRKGLSDINEFQ